MKKIIFDHIKNQKKIKLTKNMNVFLLGKTSFLPTNTPLRERLWYLKYDFDSVQKCPICNNKKLNWNKEVHEMQKCCLSCNKKTISIKKRNKTIKAKYGVSNVFQLKEIKEKSKKTKKIKYGDENYNNRKKYKETCKLKYDGIGFSSDDIRNKSKDTKNLKYGDENYNNRDKYKTNYIVKYGVSHPTKTFDHWKLSIPNKSENELLLIWEKINDEEWLSNEYQNKTVYDIANDLGISSKSIITKCKSFGIYNTKEYVSSLEKLIGTYLDNLNVNYLCNKKTIIPPLQLDFYMPEHNLAIETNGLYWHSYIHNEDKKYHLNKTLKCRDRGIQLIHIFENELIGNYFDIWKSIISNKLGQSERIYARKCEIRNVDVKLVKSFLKSNHLQGYVPSSINLGLFYQDELVSLMTFGKSRYGKKYDWELLRFCNKKYISVIGGASRLFKNFIKSNKGTIVSYADMRRSDGNLYAKLGFELSHVSEPNYWYFKNNNMILESRVKYQKHKLGTILEKYDERLSEWLNMKYNGYNKIYDCGNQVWVFVK